MHQFVQAGISLYNPDKPDRPVNSPYAVYQVAPACLELVRSYATELYKDRLAIYLTTYKTLAQQYARNREMAMVPLHLSESLTVPLSPGRHSELICATWEEFGPRFVAGGTLVYAGDTGEKWGYFDQKLFAKLGLKIDSHGKMPDVIIYDRKRNWLILAEAVTSHGPVDVKRHQELSTLFKSTKAGLVFVTVFPDRRTFTKYAELISWETEVWIADNPTHLIHFNGARFLGPYT